MKFRKKPTVIEAFQYKVGQPVPKGVFTQAGGEPYQAYVMTTHNQMVFLSDGDWIVAEPDGNGYYPIKPHIMEQTYEVVAVVHHEDCAVRAGSPGDVCDCAADNGARRP